MRAFIKIFSITAGILVVMVFAGYSLLHYLGSHPSDETLIGNFEKNQAAFSGLVDMIQQDQGLERVDDDWTRPANPNSIGVTNERIAKYREIFKALKIPRGFNAFTKPTSIELIASTTGLSISGSMKGYAYLETRPDLVVEDLDNYQSPDGRSFTAYRHISGNWYLVYDYED